MRKMLVVIMALAGCAQLKQNLDPTSRPAGPAPRNPAVEVPKMWQGRPAIDMESHSLFSMMGPQRQELSDGSAIVHHMRCVDWADPDRAVSHTSNPGLFGQVTTTTVRPGEKGRVCCDRQFILRDGMVEEFRAVPMGGECKADWAFAPEAHRAPPTTAAAARPEPVPVP